MYQSGALNSCREFHFLVDLRAWIETDFHADRANKAHIGAFPEVSDSPLGMISASKFEVFN
jgi:hypothetical protein